MSARSCPSCGDDRHIYRRADETWNPDREEWEFSATEGAAECTTCDWLGPEAETRGPLCQGCGRPEAACSAEPCPAVIADRAPDLIAQLAEALSAWATWHANAIADDDCAYLNGKGWSDAETLANNARTALAAARGEG